MKNPWIFWESSLEVTSQKKESNNTDQGKTEKELIRKKTSKNQSKTRKKSIMKFHSKGEEIGPKTPNTKEAKTGFGGKKTLEMREKSKSWRKGKKHQEKGKKGSLN